MNNYGTIIKDEFGNFVGVTNGAIDSNITNFNDLSLQLALNNDAFARLRVSEPFTIFDSKQIVNTTLFFDDQEVSGGGTNSTYDADRASTTLSCTALTAGKRVRQTFQRFNYQPGKSQMFIETFCMKDTPSGYVKEVGYKDSENGIFLRNDGGSVSFVVTSYVTGSPDDTVIPQANWNKDTMDGNGDSGVTLDFEKAQIFFVDFEWLGVGTIRFGFFIDGQPIYAHYQNHANNIDSVYMSNPNLPIHYSIENDGSGAIDSYLEHICSTVISEGSVELTGIVRSIDRGLTAFTTGNNTSLYPLLSMRLKSGSEMITIIPSSLEVFTSSSVNYRWELVMNPTVAGVDAAVWTPLTNSAIEYDITRSTVNTISGGTILASGYGSSTNQAKSVVSTKILNAIKLGASIAGARDQLVLAVQNLAAGTNAYYGQMEFRELL